MTRVKIQKASKTYSWDLNNELVMLGGQIRHNYKFKRFVYISTFVILLPDSWANLEPQLKV